jgi:hypothetical protein
MRKTWNPKIGLSQRAGPALSGPIRSILQYLRLDFKNFFLSVTSFTDGCQGVAYRLCTVSLNDGGSYAYHHHASADLNDAGRGSLHSIPAMGSRELRRQRHVQNGTNT